jgi:hypothetical protein
VVKHAHAAELYIVVAAVLAAADAVLVVAHHLLKLGAHLVTTLARLHVNILVRSYSQEEGITPEKKSGEGRRDLRNFDWEFSTG